MPVCVLCGLDFAGKTSISLWLKSLNSQAALRTVASTDIETVKKKDLLVFVIPGHVKFRYNEEFYRLLFPQADKVVFVVDAADRTRFSEAREYFKFVREMMRKYCRGRAELIICAHKQDLPGAASGYIVRKHVAPDAEGVRVLETSIHDDVSMVNLLRVLYDMPTLHPLDVLVQEIATKLAARCAFIADDTALPLAMVGEEHIVFPFLVDSLRFYEDREQKVDFLACGDGNGISLVVFRRCEDGVLLVGAIETRVSISSAIGELARLADRAIKLVSPRI